MGTEELYNDVMGSDESNNLDRDELFKVIKGKCKSKSRANIIIGLTLLILIIVTFIYRINHPFQYRQGIASISFFVNFAINGCVCGLWALNNYCFLKKSDSLDTPAQLMYWYEKRIRIDRKCFFLFLSAYLLDGCLCSSETLWLGLTVFIILFVIGALLFFKSSNSFWNSSNKLLEQLQELVDIK